MKAQQFKVADMTYTAPEAEALELARRIVRNKMQALHDKSTPRIIGKEQALHMLTALLGGLDKECFYCVSLNTAGHVLAIDHLGVGSVGSVAAPVREVMRSALKANASAIVLVHNHPSGQIDPSREDIALTVTIAKICAALDIALLDHFIIAGDEARSIGSEYSAALAAAARKARARR